jgi:hypothetical protein
MKNFFHIFVFVDAGGLGSLESKVNPKGLYTGPYFSPAILSNYTVMVGDTVHLPCQVGGGESKVNPKGLYTGPYFSPVILSNYTIMVEDTLHLLCQVGGLGTLGSKENPTGLYTGPI